MNLSKKMKVENPDWKKLSCQECVKKYPHLKYLITPFAEDIIKQICEHNSITNCEV